MKEKERFLQFTINKFNKREPKTLLQEINFHPYTLI